MVWPYRLWDELPGAEPGRDFWPIRAQPFGVRKKRSVAATVKAGASGFQYTLATESSGNSTRMTLKLLCSLRVRVESAVPAWMIKEEYPLAGTLKVVGAALLT